jgi:hypothetical protein
MLVYGNIVAPSYILSELGEKDAKDFKNKKFKYIAKEYSKQEAKQNKIINKGINIVNSVKGDSGFDIAKLNSGKAMIDGANMKQKELAYKKIILADGQTAILDTAEEYGVLAEHLAKGKFVPDKNTNKNRAKYGIEIAQGGTKRKKTNSFYDYPESETSVNQTVPVTNVPPSIIAAPQPIVAAPQPSSNINLINETEAAYNKAVKSNSKADWLNFQETYHKNFADEAEAILRKRSKMTKLGIDLGYTDADLAKLSREKLFEINKDGRKGESTDAYAAALKKKKEQGKKTTYDTTSPQIKNEIVHSGDTPSDNIPSIERKDDSSLLERTQIEPKKDKKDRFPRETIINSVMPELRPSDQEPLDSTQLLGETYVLGQKEEPVQAQQYNPLLSTPYDISLQDQLNEITAQSRAAERMAGQDPAAAAAIFGQASLAKSKVLADQFRMNQAMKAGVYKENRDALNQASIQNLGIMDNQYVRQATAKSKTKADTLAALNSISSKIAQNKLSNRKLAVYENMYNYRYDPNFRIRNMNPLAQFDVERDDAASTDKSKSKKSTLTKFKEWLKLMETEEGSDDKPAKHGAKIKNKNSSVVRAIKNL